MRRACCSSRYRPLSLLYESPSSLVCQISDPEELNRVICCTDRDVLILAVVSRARTAASYSRATITSYFGDLTLRTSTSAGCSVKDQFGVRDFRCVHVHFLLLEKFGAVESLVPVCFEIDYLRLFSLDEHMLSVSYHQVWQSMRGHAGFLHHFSTAQ